MTRQAVVIAGGMGTRLRSRVGDRPKALAEVGGVALLEHQLRLCARHSITDVVLLLGYGAQYIRDFVGDGSTFGISVRYVVEDTPLGTAGAVMLAYGCLEPQFLVLYADTMMDIDLDRLWTFHVSGSNDITLLVHPNDHPFDSDLVVVDRADRVTEFLRGSAAADRPIRNLASAALYVVNRDALDGVKPREGTLDFGKHVFPDLLVAGKHIGVYRTAEYIKDAGTPERLDHVNTDYASGRVDPARSGRALEAVFLDRDGTLNVEVDGVRDPDALVLLPGTAAALRRLNKSGMATVVVTNQPFVARGEVTEDAIEAIHARLERKLADGGAYFDALYYCPHHPHSGYAGERAELKLVCGCRKPAPGMLLSAARDLNLDLSKSWMIGDRAADVSAGRAAGVRSVLLLTERDEQASVQPDYAFHDLDDATRFILDHHAAARQRAMDLIDAAPVGAEIYVGGLARSGKSVWASVFAEAAADRGETVFKIALDDWLIEPALRSGGDVMTRYDVAGVSAFLHELRGLTEATAVTFPRYDRHARRRREAPGTAVFHPGARIIVDGVLALDLPDVPGNAMRVAIRTDEELRRDRFMADYRWRGWSCEAAELAYRERLRDEAPIVDKGLETATVTLSGQGKRSI